MESTKWTESRGRVHSLPTVPQSVRGSAESYTSEALDGEDTPVEINRPIWAVDLGSEMRALSTFDLWMALSRGDLSTEVLVWRIGRECWLPAREIPELACALSERIEAEDREDAARSTLDYEDRSPHSGIFECTAKPEGSSQSAPCEALVELHKSPQIIELDPADVVTDLPPPVAVREPRRLVRARRVRRNLAASVLGAAVLAASAIAIGQPASAPMDAAAPEPQAVATMATDPITTLVPRTRSSGLDRPGGARSARGTESPSGNTRERWPEREPSAWSNSGPSLAAPCAGAGIDPRTDLRPAVRGLLDPDESILEGADLAVTPIPIEDEAPRSVARIKRVSPEKTGQHRRRQK